MYNFCSRSLNSKDKQTSKDKTSRNLEERKLVKERIWLYIPHTHTHTDVHTHTHIQLDGRPLLQIRSDLIRFPRAVWSVASCRKTHYIKEKVIPLTASSQHTVKPVPKCYRASGSSHTHTHKKKHLFWFWKKAMCRNDGLWSNEDRCDVSRWLYPTGCGSRIRKFSRLPRRQ